jgi:hypothetical protein
MEESQLTETDRQVLELFVERREVGRVESRRLGACSASERAALAKTLRELADTIEADHLERPTDEVLAQEDPALSVARGEPKEQPQHTGAGL